MSKYNKKLPKVSGICFMDSGRNTRKTEITMPFKGVIPNGVSYVGWRQPSFSYSYQPQYQVHARLTPNKQLDTGSSTSKTAWKWINPSWKTAATKPDTLNGGVTMDKKNRYYRYLNFGGKSLMTAGTYDKLDVRVCIRTYNPKQKQHGTWVYQWLTIKCVPEVQVNKIVSYADGGFRMSFDTNGWTRGGSKVILGSVKHYDEAANEALADAETALNTALDVLKAAQATVAALTEESTEEEKTTAQNALELAQAEANEKQAIFNEAQAALESAQAENKKELSDEVDAIGDEEAGDYPYAHFEGSGFNTDFRAGDKIILEDCYFRTCDGVDVSIDGVYEIDPVDAILDEPVIRVTRNEETARISVNISKADEADDWDDVQAWTICEALGKQKRYDAVFLKGADDEERAYEFCPPFDSEITLKVRISNSLGGMFEKSYTVEDLPELKPFASNNRVMLNYTDGNDAQPKNGMFNGSKIAVMNYEVDFSMDATRPHETELPFGRTRPVAFLGGGLQNTISLSGSIDATLNDDYQTTPFSTWRHWQDFQEQQGIVLLRLPEGRTYHALCTKCSIKQEDEYNETRTVDLSFDEVEI